MLKKYIFLALFFLFVFSISGVVSAANWTVGSNGTDYSSIQDAIDNINTQENDTIIVNPKDNDSYQENVIVNKAKLKLIANGSVTIQAPDLYMPVITISSEAAGTTINGFTIIGGTTGILVLDYADNCTITGNNITIGNPGSDYSNGVDSGFMIDGGIAVESNNVTISGNKIDGNYDNVKGIMVVANNCNITGNNITNSAFGILFGGSDSCTVSNNNISGCYYGIDLECNDYFFTSTNCIISQNIINNNVMNGIRISGADGDENLISNILINQNEIKNNNGSGIYLNLDTTNIVISQNNIAHNLNGLEISDNSQTNNFESLGNNTIYENNISYNNNASIFIQGGHSTLISGNNITNSVNGIVINHSYNNTIYSNIIVNNTENGIQIFDDSNNVNFVNFNRITGNNYGLYVEYGFVNATNNWWGSNNPIVSLPGPNDIVIENGTVDYSKWLVLNASASQNIISNQNCVITADLTHNNAGDDTSSKGHIPDNIPIYYFTTLGNGTGTAYTNNGRATGLFNRGSSTSGNATITVSLDTQNAQTNVTIDTVLPLITSNLTSGIFNITKNVTLNATDNIDNNPLIYYSLDNGTTWLTQSKNVLLNLGEGRFDIKFYAQDTAGNTCPIESRTYIIDKTIPNATLNPIGGYYNTTQLVTLIANDNLDPSPSVYYTLNGTTPTNLSTKYDGQITINATTTLKFLAIDFAGNTCPLQTVSFVIDRILPIVNASLANGTYTVYKTVNLTATDNNDTNPVIYFTLDGTTPTINSTRYTGPISIYKDSTNLKFFAVDKAGNQAAVQTRTYIINMPVQNLNTGKVYSTINSAINDSLTMNGHIIQIKNGTYTENIKINKTVTLQPVSGATVTLKPSSGIIISVHSGGSNSVIKGLTFRNSDNSAIQMHAASNCVIDEIHLSVTQKE